MTETYIIYHQNGTQTEITEVAEVKQVFGFVYFRDSDGDLIIALRADNIYSFAPKIIAKTQPVVATRKTRR